MSIATSPSSGAARRRSLEMNEVNQHNVLSTLADIGSILEESVSTQPISLRAALDVSARQSTGDDNTPDSVAPRGLIPTAASDREVPSTPTIRPVNQPMPGDALIEGLLLSSILCFLPLSYCPLFLPLFLLPF